MVWKPTEGSSREAAAGIAVTGGWVGTNSPGAGEAWTITPLGVGLAWGEASVDVGGGVVAGAQAASKTVRHTANLLEATFIMIDSLLSSFRAGALKKHLQGPRDPSAASILLFRALDPFNEFLFVRIGERLKRFPLLSLGSQNIREVGRNLAVRGAVSLSISTWTTSP